MNKRYHAFSTVLSIIIGVGIVFIIIFLSRLIRIDTGWITLVVVVIGLIYLIWSRDPDSEDRPLSKTQIRSLVAGAMEGLEDILAPDLTGHYIDHIHTHGTTNANRLLLSEILVLKKQAEANSEGDATLDILLNRVITSLVDELRLSYPSDLLSEITADTSVEQLEFILSEWDKIQR